MGRYSNDCYRLDSNNNDINSSIMGKLEDRLNRQLVVPEFSDDAKDCLEVYNGLKEMHDGRVWSSIWDQMVNIKFEGLHSDIRTYRLSEVGKTFLKGLRYEQ